MQMFGKASQRRLSATNVFNLFAVAGTIGLVAALQYGANARALQPSVCSNIIDSVAASPGTISTNSNSTITVTLDSAAPFGGCTADLSYTNGQDLVSPPSSLTINGGSTSGSFQVTGQSAGNVTITASDSNNSQKASLTVQSDPP